MPCTANPLAYTMRMVQAPTSIPTGSFQSEFEIKSNCITKFHVFDWLNCIALSCNHASRVHTCSLLFCNGFFCWRGVENFNCVDVISSPKTLHVSRRGLSGLLIQVFYPVIRVKGDNLHNACTIRKLVYAHKSQGRGPESEARGPESEACR
jgi:hypothetical protein